jgi:DNA polymerase
MDDVSLLKLQIAWGADEALDVLPRDRWHAPPAPKPLAAAVPPLAAPSLITPVARAAALAAAATSLDALQAALASFTDCPLQTTAIHLVFADGNPAARLMVIGDTPGEEEDRSGRPFSGPGGQLLDRMLASIGLDRTTVRLATAIPWRPPGNRKATAHERALCLPFLHRHIALVRPRRLLLLGAAAATALLDAKRKPRGWQDVRIDGLAAPVPALCTPSPEHLIANPAAKRDAWSDLIALRLALNNDPA